ncbi:MAG: Kelch repeat-containing protein [Chitinophagales bacterium]
MQSQNFTHTHFKTIVITYFLSMFLVFSSCEIWTLPSPELCVGAVLCQGHVTKLIFHADSSRVFHNAINNNFISNTERTFISGGTLAPQAGQMINTEGGTWDDTESAPNLFPFNTTVSNVDTKQLFMIGGLDSIPSSPSSTIDLLSINTSSSFASNKIDVYNSSNDWTVGNTQLPRGGHTATLISDNQIFLIGGNSDNSRTEIYDFNTSETTLSSPLHNNRYFHTSTLLGDNQIVVIGGIEYETQLTSKKVEIYNPSNNTFEERVSPNDFAPRVGHTVDSGGVANTVVIIGGQQNENEFHNDIWTYYPNQDQVFINSPEVLPFPSAYHTTTVLPNNLLLIVGGRDANKSHDGILLFDLAENKVITLDCSLTHARHGHSTTILNLDKLHNVRIVVIGGQNANGAVLQSEEIVLNLNCIKPLE